MNRPQPQSVVNEISESLKNWARDGGARLSQASAEFKSMYSELDEAQKETVVEASSAKSTLYALTGDLEKALYWAKNASVNGGKDMGRTAAYLAYLICGRPAEAYALVDQVFANLGTLPFHLFIRHTIAAGWFGKAEHFLDAAQKRSIVTKGVEGLEVISPAARVLKANSISDETVNAVMESAYRIMNSENTIWHGNLPTITVHDGGADVGFVMMRFVLHRTPHEAAELSWQLAEELASRNLDLPGLVVGFSPKTVAATREVVAA